MLRLSRLIRALNVQKELKSKIKLIKLNLQLCLYLHCQACLVLYLMQYDKLWQHPILKQEPVWDSRFYDDALFTQYMASLHISIMAMLGGDTVPFKTLGFAS